MASSWPAASIGSRIGIPTFSISTLDASMLLAWAKIFHCAKAPSAAGAPSFLPSRSFGIVTPRLLRVLIAKLDERIDIAASHVVRAGGNTRDELERAS